MLYDIILTHIKRPNLFNSYSSKLHSLSLSLSLSLYIYIYYTKSHIHTHTSINVVQFLSVCKTHHCSAHLPMSILKKIFRPLLLKPTVESWEGWIGAVRGGCMGIGWLLIMLTCVGSKLNQKGKRIWRFWPNCLSALHSKSFGSFLVLLLLFPFSIWIWFLPNFNFLS